MRNLHQYYYQDYFKGIDFGYLSQDEKASRAVVNEIQRRNNVLTSEEYAHKDRKLKVIPELPSDDKHFNNKQLKSIPLEIMYPGLVTGIGMKHETKIEDEFKLGMHFDWTYGVPVIYGSSVKGVLRSAFIAKVEKGEIVEYDDFFLKETKADYAWDQKSIMTLFNAIFEGKNLEGENISIYERDIFFDAVIVESDKKRHILCSDSITPHGDNPLKNPTPLTFMKIAPGCKVYFRFKLKPTEIVNSKDEKLSFDEIEKQKLFRKILTTVGIGAKTNVGYGQLTEPKQRES